MNLQSETNHGNGCPRPEIAEYIDGELQPFEEMDLELHFSGCKICLDEVNAQKKVFSSLDILLGNEADQIKLPENFTKVLAAKAESNLDGVRTPGEQSRALVISAILILCLILGFGTESGTLFFAIEKFAEQIFAVSGFVFHLFYTLAFGVSAIFGSLCHKFIFRSSLVLILIISTFVISFLLLSRMVFRFNRSSQ